MDTEANRTLAVRQALGGGQQACDDRWHSVRASYVESALTLKLDHLDEQYAFATHGHARHANTRGPLFIGGLPGSFPSFTPDESRPLQSHPASSNNRQLSRVLSSSMASSSILVFFFNSDQS